MNASQEKTRTLYHLEDFHDEPSVQQGLARKISELYEQEKIQAVFCENYRASPPTPLDESFFINSNTYLGFLSLGKIPIYGTENREMHEQHTEITKKLYTTRKTLAVIKAKISEKEKKLEDGIGEISDVAYMRGLINNLEVIGQRFSQLMSEEARILEIRTKFIVNYATYVSNQNGYENIAFVCGGEHREAIRARSEQLGFSYIAIAFQTPNPNHVSNEAFLKKLFEKKEPTEMA